MDMQKIERIKQLMNVRVYNATNHDVSIYLHDCINFTSSRGGNSFTVVDGAMQNLMPIEVFPKRQPLSVSTVPFAGTMLGNLRIELPDSLSSNPLPINYLDYDVIIVSQMYAQYAVRYLLDRNFVDRLYTVGAGVYSTPNAKHPIGTMGLKKVDFPNGCGYLSDREYNPIPRYLNEFACGRIPSLVAVIQMVDYFISTGQQNITMSKQFDDLVDCLYNAVRQNPRYTEDIYGHRVYHI